MRNGSKNFLLLILIVVGLTSVAYYVNKKYSFYRGQDSIVGSPAPLFETATLDGKTFVLKDVIGKKVVLLNLWATWCEPCQVEMPVLIALSKALDPTNFELVSLMENDVSEGDLKKALASFERKIPLPFPVYSDANGMIADALGTYKIPESFLIDLTGTIVEHIPGVITEWDQERLIKRINELTGSIPKSSGD